MRLIVTLGGVALALLTPVSSARADLIPWMYNWSRSPSVITSDAPGTGYVTLTDESQKSAVGDSNIVATNIRTYSSATATNPDRFTNKAFSLTLSLFDVDSGTSGAMTFHGLLNGTLTALSANLRPRFPGVTTQEIVLGNHRYTATLSATTPPGPPGSINSGSISGPVHITVEPVVTVPEPASLTLSGLGLAIVGLARWRRRLRLPQG